ncbi:hypothetical protein BH11VER1_BH11VER1_14120 [soil metagenome]
MTTTLPPYTFLQGVEMRPDILRPYAVLIFIVAAVLLLVWLIQVLKRRRPYKLLAASVIVLVTVGYLAFDLEHVSLNIKMRDAHRVKEDCVELIKQRESMIGEKDKSLRLKEAQLPSSFSRIGAKSAFVGKDYVAINLIRDWNGGEWGFLFDQHPDIRTKKLRSTCYRDFYEYRVRGA